MAAHEQLAETTACIEVEELTDSMMNVLGTSQRMTAPKRLIPNDFNQRRCSKATTETIVAESTC